MVNGSEQGLRTVQGIEDVYVYMCVNIRVLYLCRSGSQSKSSWDEEVWAPERFGASHLSLKLEDYISPESLLSGGS